MMERLQNVADPKNWSGNAALGLLDHAFRQGAGMLDIVGAVTANATVAPGQIASGESASGSHIETLDGAQPVELPRVVHGLPCRRGRRRSEQRRYRRVVRPERHLRRSGDGDAERTSLSVPSRGTATVDVTIAANAALPDRSLYGGYIRFTPVGTGTPMSVPYAGFKGDYQSTVVLTPTANGFPWLAKLAGGHLHQPARRRDLHHGRRRHPATSCSTSTTSRAR